MMFRNLTATVIMSILFFNTSVAQTGNTPQVKVLSKTGGTIAPGKSRPDSLMRYRTGILVMESSNGIIYKSHLRDYKEITVELLNKDGELLYEFKNELIKNVDYNIAVGKMPQGEYILRFSLEDRLVICNLEVGS